MSATKEIRHGSLGKITNPNLDKTMVSIACDIPEFTVLVRLPKALKTPAGFRQMLARDTSLNAFPWSYGGAAPKGRQVGKYRHFILRDSYGQHVRYLKGLIKALADLGVLELAEVFIADREAGLLRRLVAALPAREQAA